MQDIREMNLIALKVFCDFCEREPEKACALIRAVKVHSYLKHMVDEHCRFHPQTRFTYDTVKNTLHLDARTSLFYEQREREREASQA